MRAARLPALHRPRLLPTSPAGRWALGLFVASVAGFLVMTVGAPGQGPGTISGSWWLAVPALVSGAGAAASGVVGTYAILRRHEHAALVYTTTALGLLVISYVLGEALNAH